MDWLGIGVYWQLTQMVSALGAHFGLGFGVGLLTYLSMLTTCRFLGIPVWRMWRFWLQLSFLFSIASHVLQDYLLGQF